MRADHYDVMFTSADIFKTVNKSMLKLCFNTVKLPIICKLGYGWLTRLGIFTVQLHWPADSVHNQLPSPRQ